MLCVLRGVELCHHRGCTPGAPDFRDALVYQPAKSHYVFEAHPVPGLRSAVAVFHCVVGDPYFLVAVVVEDPESAFELGAVLDDAEVFHFLNRLLAGQNKVGDKPPGVNVPN